MGVPKTVTWQRRDCDLNPAPESSTLEQINRRHGKRFIYVSDRTHGKIAVDAYMLAMNQYSAAAGVVIS